MDPYKKMYYKLFSKMSDFISDIQVAQCESEELFISSQKPKPCKKLKLQVRVKPPR